MFPSVSKAVSKAAHVTHQAVNAVRHVPNVVSHIVGNAENITHPPTSWANTNPNSEYLKSVQERVQSNLGSVADHEMCARAAQNALLGHSGEFADATTWQRSVPKNEWHSYNPKEDIPAGVAVFYPSSNPHGHVAVSMGGGKVYTTDAYGRKAGVVNANQVFGDRSPLGWSDWAKSDLGTDQGRGVIGLDNRASFSPSRPSSETGAARQESFSSSLASIGDNYMTPTTSVGGTPTSSAKRGVLGLDVDTSST